MTITTHTIAKIDLADMFGCLVDFPEQVEEALRIGAETPLLLTSDGVRLVTLTGMGGSAIAGDLLRSYLADELTIPLQVNRSYSLPKSVDRDSLLIVSSYSGNTEETLSAYREAIKRNVRILVITTGGEVGRIAQKHGHPCINVPSGLQPRVALGYSFFPLLLALMRMGFISPRPKEIDETVASLQTFSRTYSTLKTRRNRALSIAKKLHGKLAIVYSATDHLDAVNLRWRGQICENAKRLAFGHVLPEMNHNEIVGWNPDRSLAKKLAVVFLRDGGSHERIRLREEVTKRIVRKQTSSVIDVWSEGTSLLARIFSLVYLGDWVSYYLALLNNEDPTPVKVIDFLKGELAKA